MRRFTVATLFLAISSSASAQGDRDALVALYNSTGGESWSQSDNWNTDSDISTWYGITASDAGRVTGISMPENNLTGELPPEIGELSALTQLVLRDNDLTGAIPAEIGNLSELTRLNLRRNNLTGVIPAEILMHPPRSAISAN